MKKEIIGDELERCDFCGVDTVSFYEERDEDDAPCRGWWNHTLEMTQVSLPMVTELGFIKACDDCAESLAEEIEQVIADKIEAGRGID